ncbi:hypothetical protein [Candidatus Leptofilum sp.]|uniref:hypothetical protein n=1 Tax=Candidatus Leptofilum sp. TaxID=3241576 RepID=UPI003B5A8B65
MPNTVNLYYEPQRQQRPVVPTPRQAQQLPGRINEQQPFEFTPYAVNCPRCGADNRNWLALLQTNNQGMQQRFPVVRLANYVLWSFVALALTLIFFMDIHLGKAAVLLVAIPAAIFGTIWELTREWSGLRENQHVKKVLPKRRSKETELWIRGGILIFLFTIVFPIIFFSLAPTSFRIFLELAQDSPESEVDEAATAVSLSVNQQIDATQDEFADIAGQMQDLLDELPSEDLPSVEAEIDTLSDRLADTVVASETALEQIQAESETAIQVRRTAELDAITEARKNAIEGLKGDLVANLGFLTVWGVSVGIPTLVAVFIGMAAVKQFVGQVDRELPPPVFHSVANMTRLVTWEARQALEVGNQHFDIQWMSVNRNDSGGLDLVGLFRDPPEFNTFGQAIGNQVRAQKHTIHTDMWCRVKEAKIEDVMVPVPAGAPAGIMHMPVAAQHDAPANVRIRLPER